MKKSRRDFLVKGSLALGSGLWVSTRVPPVEQFMELLTNQWIRRAVAGDRLPEVNYLSFNFLGAPARWCFDQMVKTRTDQTYTPNPSVVTRLTGASGVYNAAEYVTVDYNGVEVPWIWNTHVGGPGGVRRALSDLLPHLIVFRGYGSGIDGHPSNLARQSNPVPSAGSLSGHVADRSNRIFRALQFPPFGSASGYSSLMGSGLTLIFQAGQTNYGKILMKPFTSREDTKKLTELRDYYGEMISGVHDQLRFLASSRISGLEPLDLDYSNSIKTLQEGIGDLDSAWASLYSKYENIVWDSVKDRTVAGLSDRPIMAQADETWSVAVGTDGLKPTPGIDLRDWFNSANFNSLISSFALAEFVMTRGYSSALEFGSLEPSGLKGAFAGSTNLTNFNLILDQHSTGAASMTFLNMTFFRAFGACLLELVAQFKTLGIFEKTFIHLVQEFGRSPRSNGSGSDHSFDGMIASLITGAQSDGPLVLGNIAKVGGTDSTNYPGTYGYKAITNISGEKVLLSPIHIASTMAVLMGLEKNPWGNLASPLILRKSEGLEVRASGEIV